MLHKIISLPGVISAATIANAADDGSLGTMTSAAGDGTYTYDEDALKMCIESDAYNGCLTFAEPGNEVGHTSAYTGDNGASGTATVVAAEE